MVASITGTVAFTCDSSQNASYIGGAGANASFFWGRGCFNAAETFWYAHCRNGTGRLHRVDLTGGNAGKISILYAATGIPSTPTACVLSPDGTLIYVFCQQVTALMRVYSLAADGSSGATTEVYTESLNAPPRVIYDPTTGGIFLANSNDQYLGYYTPGAWAARTIYHFPPGPMFMAGIGRDYNDSDALLWSTDANYSSGVFRYKRSQGRSYCLVGGAAGGSGGTGADPFAIATGACYDPVADQDGRVYYGDGANRARRLDGSGVADLSAFANAGGMAYLPSTVALIVSNASQTIRKLT